MNKENITCAYCELPAQEKIGVCMTTDCLRRNHQRRLYYEAAMWQSEELPKNAEPPEWARPPSRWERFVSWLTGILKGH